MNKKGFFMMETLAVIVFCAGIFTFIYISVIPLIGTYNDLVIRESSVDIVYKLYNIRLAIQKDNKLKEIIQDNELKKITCNDFKELDYCNNLMSSMELSDYDLFYTSSIKNNLESFNSYQEVYDYLKKYQEEDYPTLILIDNKEHTIAHLDYYELNPTAFGDMMKSNVKKDKIDFGKISSDTNGKGIYLLNGEETNNKPIYYYRGDVDNNNVIFAGFCWQIVRTTETGGTKMIYNGKTAFDTTIGRYVCNNKEANERQLEETSAFNANMSSMSGVGYMYNEQYEQQIKYYSENVLSITSLSESFWYADSVTYASVASGKYSLNNPYKVSSTSDYSSLVGKYTFRNENENNTANYVFYIAEVRGSTMYAITLSSGKTIDDEDYTYTYGDGYVDNGNDTYTITNPTTIKRSEWHSNNSVFNNKYVCKQATNNTCSEVWYVTSVLTSDFRYIKTNNIFKYSKSVTYENNTYKLDDANSTTFWNVADNENKNSLNNAHYTCWNESGECTSVSYIYYIGSTADYYYINLNDGDKIEDVIYKMTGNGTNEVKTRNSDYKLNVYDSLIKTKIDQWFKKNLTDEENSCTTNYQEYLEDTVFCNDRDFQKTGDKSYENSGWNPNGGDLNTYINFNVRTKFSNNNWYNTTNRPTIKCSKEEDSFSTSNEKAKLKYPVGLLTADEVILAGASGNSKTANKKYYLYTGNSIRIGTASSYNTNAFYNLGIDIDGSLNGLLISVNTGIRPVISLKSDVEYEKGGNGTPTNPYVVKVEQRECVE